MPMKRDDYEAILNELLTPELEHTRKTELLQTLRADYSNVTSDFTDLTKTKDKLQKDNSDLVTANSLLFRQVGVVGAPEDQQTHEKEKQFSETITIEDLEKEM